MSAPGSPGAGAASPGARVARGLERVLDALAQSDAEGARAAAQDAADACAALSAQGVRLPPEDAAALAARCARAQEIAGGVLARLGDELSGAARSRRAADAYGAPASAHRHLP